ncbi:Uncharacterised protein [Chlamydia trachomatis]|nr:Uncharacterised protein [Chlamydia trachomatis]
MSKTKIQNKIPKPICAPVDSTKFVLAKKTTNIPPCGAIILIPNKAEEIPVTIPAIIFEGKSTFGLLAVYGIAPSEIKDNPKTILEYLPA